jgi:hypothetical protein
LLKDNRVEFSRFSCVILVRIFGLLYFIIVRQFAESDEGRIKRRRGPVDAHMCSTALRDIAVKQLRKIVVSVAVRAIGVSTHEHWGRFLASVAVTIWEALGAFPYALV